MYIVGMGVAKSGRKIKAGKNEGGKIKGETTYVAKSVMAKSVMAKTAVTKSGGQIVSGKMRVAKCEWRYGKLRNVESGKL